MKRLIINDSLKSGTQLPFIERAKMEGYGVVVTNTNQNYAVDENGKRQKIQVLIILKRNFLLKLSKTSKL